MPELSVVIPTCRRPVQLGRALQALAAQTADRDRFEVIVVNNAPESAAVDLGALRGTAARQLHQPVRGASAARNAGWRAAAAPVVLFIGDDILGDPEMVELHLAFHARRPEPQDGMLGHVRWADALPQNDLMRWLDRGIQADYARLERGEAPSWGDFMTSQVSVKRALLEASGGFDEHRFPFLYEDTELGHRLFRLGLRLHYEPRARAQHLHRPTMDEWRRRMAVVAAAERRFTELHGEAAWFEPRMRAAATAPPARPRLARVLGPLGHLGWARAAAWADHQLDLAHRQELAGVFLDAWDAGDD